MLTVLPMTFRKTSASDANSAPVCVEPHLHARVRGVAGLSDQQLYQKTIQTVANEYKRTLAEPPLAEEIQHLWCAIG